MSSGVLPIGKIVYVCDDVMQDVVNGNITVIGVFNAVQPPDGGNYPFRLSQLCVFAQFAGGLGQVDLEARVIDAATGNDIFASPVYFVNFPGGQTLVTVAIRMRNCPFPHPGTYFVQLYCQGSFVDDRRLVAH